VLQVDATTTCGLELWKAAARWRRAVEHALAGLNLTFTQWAAVAAADAVIRETGDATTQNAIAERMELDRSTLSHVMRALEHKGLVDRGPHAKRIAYRLWVTRAGHRALRAATAAVDEASRTSLQRLLVTETSPAGQERTAVDLRLFGALRRVS
jgi:DNA-binding MarR family transcriptional regulator